jgi:hypothetical protein
MKIICLQLLLVILFSACKNNSEYPGFSKSREGFYYQLHSIGESDEKPQTGDYITADISYLTLKDSLFFEGRRKIKLEEPKYQGAIEDCFKMLGKEESATFILPAEPFFKQTLESDLPKFFKSGENLKIKIHIVDIQSEGQYENEKIAFLNWIEDFGDYEKVILKQYIQRIRLIFNPIQAA